MNGYKDGIAVSVSVCGTFSQRNEDVAFAGQSCAIAFFSEQVVDAHGGIERKVFFIDSATDGTFVSATVTSIKDDGFEFSCVAEIRSRYKEG